MQDVLKQRLRTVNWFGLGATSMVLAAAILFGILPMLRTGHAKIDEAQDLRKQLSSLDGLSENLEKVKIERLKNESRLREVERRLPNTDKTDDLVSELMAVAKSAGITQVTTEFSTGAANPGSYRSRQVKISGQGEWDSCYKLLTGIRLMNRITRLDSVAIDVDKDPKSQAAARPLCKIEVSFSAFFMPG